LSLNLTPEEIFEITGAIRHKTQVSRLRAMGFVVAVRADGAPIVSRQHYQLKMGGLDGKTTQEERGPNFDALRDYLNGCK